MSWDILVPSFLESVCHISSAATQPRILILFKMSFTPVWFLFCLKEALSMVWFFLMMVLVDRGTYIR